jgi:hypothetical protein
MHFARRSPPVTLLLALAAACGGALPAVAGVAASDPATAGIWKAVVPPAGVMHGEFDNDDPVGLAAGVRIPADCSINWVDPDAGRLYCFSTATSLVVFLDTPHAYLRRAQAQWLRLGGRAR